MPQINRIRVNNVKYNFGTQFYDDFMMRFHCSNTLYDLANGGGKSLLLLLLLQNVIPNCTLDEKQPVEKLFRAGGGNTVIHSLVEWKLDACYQRDNYKYMTTGFCARKARSAEPEENAVQAAGVVSEKEMKTSGAPGSVHETSSIEYFNYCIFYREFGDNDIRNLPLTSNGERITYNGLKTYLRELEKKDFNVSVRIFDRKGDYQHFISKYGIYESQWEIVRGINKTEGHVRTYFETSYRTSRKVVEDLLIEGIIQKSFNHRLGVENDEGKMAQTLLDIKEKLLELSKKHAQMTGYDSQISAMEDFAAYVGTFRALYEKKERLERMLFDFLLSCRREINRQEEVRAEQERLCERMQQELVSEQRGIQTAEVISEQNSLHSVEALMDVGEKALTEKEAALAALQERLTLLESANDYSDYEKYFRLLNEVQETVNNRMRSHEDIIKELQVLAGIYYERSRSRLAAQKDRCSLARQEALKCSMALQEARERQKTAEQNAAVENSRIVLIQQGIEEEETQLAHLMEETGLLVAENASAEALRLKEALAEQETRGNALARSLEHTRQRRARCQADLAGSKVRAQVLKEEHDRQQEQCKAYLADRQRRLELQKIYGVSRQEVLRDAILHVCRKMDRVLSEKETEADALRTFIENAKAGTYICKDPLRDKLWNYLTQHYGEDVVDGHTWFRNLNAGQKRDVFKRAPFIEYSFVVKNDFERIRQDQTLQNFERGAFAVPVVSEQILYDTRLEVNKELVAFAMKDMAFLRNDARCEAELTAAAEELETLQNVIEKQADRRRVVWEDYLFAVRQEVLWPESGNADTGELDIRIEKNAAQQIELETQNAQLTGEIQEMEKQLQSVREMTAVLKKQLQLLSMAEQRSTALAQKYQSIKESRECAIEAAAAVTTAQEQVREGAHALENANAELAAAQEALSKLNTEWESSYQPYYVPEWNASEETGTTDRAEIFSAWPQEKLESRFFGLKAVLEQETVDIADKETLMNHYRVSMEKCRQAIAYRGLSFETVQSAYTAGKVATSAPETLLEIKKQLETIIRETHGQRSELDAQNALMNRLEGSIAHGIHQIEEKYGAFEPFDCEQPERFIRQHRELLQRLGGSLCSVQQKIQQTEKTLKALSVIEKDLERIVANAGMYVPTAADSPDKPGGAEPENTAGKTGGESANLMEYEQIYKEYSRHMKQTARRRDEFERQKQRLADRLNGLNAPELAQEIRDAVLVPDTIAQTEQLIDRLNETNTYIRLEKERISKGIEDMERIKENFENRCIQTCSNIKTELDRLPQLSNITMDDEVISMIGLYVPYIKEGLYKERMSAYIDETIVMAESFKNADDRLKYIRNRLTWKRLFSVIVTDMNAVRINLYKRERIKDQSRYLRYEEAVGSTGQSQGIYIQFLIAVINYISSINASSKETALLGKTIFIDNPFGAAKDIYIWEPIFKLLKTNHVQLIVPARGATPAITGRFDVNYILGQKLVDKRQQTVVVDYYSKTSREQMEYTRMDYEQVSFDFLIE